MSVEDRFWTLFEGAMGRNFERKNREVASVEEWDSLTHIELIFELESEFGVQFSQHEVADYYSNTDSIIDHLKRETTGS